MSQAIRQQTEKMQYIKPIISKTKKNFNDHCGTYFYKSCGCFKEL